MESSEDKQWASKYLLDPLTAPNPSEETGPGSHHIAAPTSVAQRKPVPITSVRSSTASVAPSEKARSTVGVRSSNNAFRDGAQTCYPSPPNSASPRNGHFPNFDGSYTPSNRLSTDQASTQIPTSTGGVASSTASGRTNRTRRTSSLSKRHPGDQSHHPLDMLRASEKAAHRSPHLRKKHHVGTDSIDSLDNVAGGAYHHEGPYDATLMARNISSEIAPIEAVSRSNDEALKATPREMIQDSVERHYPLDGVAMVPPGTTDRYGRTYQYTEGTDMMREAHAEGGPYKQWPGVKYLPEDLKGKGEPSYSLEKALTSHKKLHRRNVSEGNTNGSIEMTPNSPTASTARPGLRHRPSSADAASVTSPVEGQRYSDWEGGLNRDLSGSGKLRKRIGSLKIRNR